jgi:adenylate cyclase
MVYDRKEFDRKNFGSKNFDRPNFDRANFDLSATLSGELNQLSPSTVYYLRKLLRHNLDRLAPVNHLDYAFDPVSNLNAAIDELYPDAQLRTRNLHKLERLALYHQTLTANGSQHSQQVTDAEDQVFNLLGYNAQKLETIGTVLLIDDTPEDISLLTRTFTQQTYRVIKSNQAEAALALVDADRPDLIFLDVLVAGVNGYDLCHQIKSNPDTQDIPIIFTSALNDAQSKVKAFQAGGADFITKPFQIEEVLVRAQHQLQRRDLQRRLGEQNVRLQLQIQENQELEGRYRSIIESSIDGIFQSSVDGQFLSVNPAMARIYGYDSPEELMAKMTNIREQLYVQPARRDGLNAYLKQHGQVVGAESRVYRKDGKKIWISENVRAVQDHRHRILYYEGTVRDVTDRRKMESALRHQRQETERLLASLLPPTVADRLRDRREMIADRVENATVLVADIQGFTRLSQQLSTTALLELMSRLFSSFDQLVEAANLEKIKTMRDVYIVAGGVHTDKPDHTVACAQLALDMQATAAQIQAELGLPFQLRIGISTGSVIASVIGLKKITYDLWGECANLASRMQSSALPGKIQVAPTTAATLVNQFILESRGETEVLGIGTIETFWLLDKKMSIKN